MTDETFGDQPTDAAREGILFPNLDEISNEWQAKADELVALLRELIGEIRSIQGVTIVVNRSDFQST